MIHPDIGKKVLVRTQSSGVHYGSMIYKKGMEVILQDAIRIYYWSGAFTLSQMAMEGVKKPDKCKFAMPVNRITVVASEILSCTHLASKNIEDVVWKKA